MFKMIGDIAFNHNMSTLSLMAYVIAFVATAFAIVSAILISYDVAIVACGVALVSGFVAIVGETA